MIFPQILMWFPSPRVLFRKRGPKWHFLNNAVNQESLSPSIVSSFISFHWFITTWIWWPISCLRKDCFCLPIRYAFEWSGILSYSLLNPYCLEKHLHRVGAGKNICWMNDCEVHNWKTQVKNAEENQIPF